MTTGAVNLCNGALRLLGDMSITSFDEGSDLAETCNNLYDDSIRGLLAAHPWSFTKRKVQLSRLADAPINEWRYAHALPSDRLNLLHIFPSARIGALPLLEYELFEGRVFADKPELWADYQVSVEPAVWPPYFTTLARAALASDFAMAVTSSASIADFWQRRAYGSPGEGGQGGLMRAARTADSMQQPPQPITDFPLLAARWGSR